MSVRRVDSNGGDGGLVLTSHDRLEGLYRLGQSMNISVQMPSALDIERSKWPSYAMREAMKFMKLYKQTVIELERLPMRQMRRKIPGGHTSYVHAE